MKRTNYLFSALTLFVCLFITSCATSKNVNFVPGSKWTADVRHGNVANADSSFIFTFPTANDFDTTTLVICRDADFLPYPKLDNYLSRIKKEVGLSEARTLVFLPEKNTLWLELPDGYTYERPKSITKNMLDECPYTMWVRNDDAEQWNRQPEEMYTYTYTDNRWKWLCIVDIFNYASTPVARVTVLQTETKRFRAIGLPGDSYWPFATTSLESIEMLSNWVDGHRAISIDNFKKGYTLKSKEAK